MRIAGVRCQVVKWYHRFFLGKQSGCILQNFKLKMFFSEFVARVFATYYTVNMLQPRFNGNFPSCCNVVSCQMLNYLFQHLIPPWTKPGHRVQFKGLKGGPPEWKYTFVNKFEEGATDGVFDATLTTVLRMRSLFFAI